MLIALDQIIPFGEEAFGRIGRLRPYAADELRPEMLRDAEALIVRSVTRVDAALLEGTPVRFVGTVSIGVDHVDQDYLIARGIHFSSAAGSNANSVAEYVTATLLVLAERRGWNLASKTLGIVGVGNVGSRVEKKARALGMSALLCDPPLRDLTGDTRYLGLEDVLQADVLTFHVPLTRTGAYPTRHMINDALLRRLPGHQVLLNSARGAVFDCSALKAALSARRIGGAALDVWESEPRIDYELLDLLELGTAHVAGYSLDGKVRGTAMILDELCRFFGLQADWDTTRKFPAPVRLLPDGTTPAQDAVRSFVLRAYNILDDDRRLRLLSGLPAHVASVEFDRLRNYYAFRPEFSHYTAVLPPGMKAVAQTLRGLGFRTEESGDGDA